MTAEEIFSEIIAHMIKGIMVHDQMMNYYLFLGLQGYAKCHEFFFIKEMQEYINMKKYFMENYNKNIKELKIDNPDIIPSSWYNHTRAEVDSATKRKSVKTGIQLWYKWQKDTKEMYSKHIKQLIDLGEYGATTIVSNCLSQVEKQLKIIMQEFLNKEAIDYDILGIIDQQSQKKEHYKKKISKIFK